MNNPYEILGVSESASREEIQQKYTELKKKYSELRFEAGDVGEDAAEKLEQVEVAYADILRELEKKENESKFGDAYGEIEDLIRKGDLAGAQQKLDDVSSRDAEWHYLQSIVFYKKNWFLESKKQLEFALSLDPKNEKYQTSLKKLTQLLASNTISPEQLKTKDTPTSSAPNLAGGASPCTGSCCTDLCLADCCCECMGGDLIPCC